MYTPSGSDYARTQTAASFQPELDETEHCASSGAGGIHQPFAAVRAAGAPIQAKVQGPLKQAITRETVQSGVVRHPAQLRRHIRSASLTCVVAGTEQPAPRGVNNRPAANTASVRGPGDSLSSAADTRLSQVRVAQTHEHAAAERTRAAHVVTVGGCTKLPSRPIDRLQLESDHGRLPKRSRPLFDHSFSERSAVYLCIQI